MFVGGKIRTGVRGGLGRNANICNEPLIGSGRVAREEGAGA